MNEELQNISLAVKTLSEISELDIQDEIKIKLANKVLLVIGIETNDNENIFKQVKPVKKTQVKSRFDILKFLKSNEGATVDEIVLQTETDVNTVLRFLEVLEKRCSVEKILINNIENNEPVYLYKLKDNQNNTNES